MATDNPHVTDWRSDPQVVEIGGQRYEIVITGEAEVIPGPNRAANLAAAGLPPDEESEV